MSMFKKASSISSTHPFTACVTHGWFLPNINHCDSVPKPEDIANCMEDLYNIKPRSAIVYGHSLD